MWNYTNSVIDHFSNPRNVGTIEDANAIGEVGSLACGDALKLYLKIDPAQGLILDAKFQTFGCASAIASASALTEMIKGKTIDEAMNITNDDIARFLGGLPEQKMHCSVMGREALESAIANYRGEKVVEHQEVPVICKCFWIAEDKIREVIRENQLTTVEQITNYTKAGGGCGGCIPDLQNILEEEVARRQTGTAQPAPASKAASPAPGTKMTNLQRIALITQTIENEVAPAMRRDGGDIELIDVSGLTVIVRLKGACAHCLGAKGTLQHLVQETLRRKVAPEITVVEESHA
jgi:NifU-like protein